MINIFSLKALKEKSIAIGYKEVTAATININILAIIKFFSEISPFFY